MISCLGNGKEEGVGSFLVLDSNFNIKKENWDNAMFGYDFWY
jgi:selenium-binding protein 1